MTTQIPSSGRATSGRHPVPGHPGRSDLLRRLLGVDAWRQAGTTLSLMPVSVATAVATAVGGRAWAGGMQVGIARRHSRARVPLISNPGAGRTMTTSLLGIALGALAWVAAIGAGPNTVRNLAYGWVDGESAATSWGGPTLAGAWVLHALVALAFVPLELAIIRGVGMLHARLLDQERPLWVLPTALALAIAGAVFIWALSRQL